MRSLPRSIGTGSQPTRDRYGDAVNGLEAAVRRVAGASGAPRVGVAAGRLGEAPALLVDGDAPFYAASTMKIAVLLELYRRAWAGALSLDEPLVVRNAFRSLVDGTPFTLDPGEDADEGLYELEGAAVAAGDLARRMIVRSSNLATNLLVDRLGAAAIDATVRGLGVTGVHVVRGVGDEAAFAAGRNSTVTASGLATLLERIAEGTAAPPDACAAMVEVLAAQEFNEGIPGGLPSGTRVAHKTGWIASLYHDAGIVYPVDAPPYVLVVLTEGLDETVDGPALVASLSRAVHDVLGAP
jgi:beta-lactamase class A